MFRTKPHASRYSGFTLVELLIVIAIIGILAAILFPVFARARENARRALCQSNLKQIGLGILQYVQDYDEVLPSAAFGNSDNTIGSYYRWQDAIYPYVKSQQVFNCPSHAAGSFGYKAYKYQPNPTSTDMNTNNNGSYAINSLYYNSQAGPVSYLDVDQLPAALQTSLAPRKLTSIGIPAETVWVFDVHGNVFFLPGVNTSADSPTIRTTQGYPYLSRNGSDGVIFRHLETTNVLWCDGHVKAVKIDVLATKSSANNLKYFTNAND